MDNICIVANGIVNGIVALVMPNINSVYRLAIEKFNYTESTSIEEICANQVVNAFVLDSIHQTGYEQKLKPVELPSLVSLCAEQWSPDNNLLTAAMKLKRVNIAHQYSAELERMFDILRKDPSKIRVRPRKLMNV